LEQAVELLDNPADKNYRAYTVNGVDTRRAGSLYQFHAGKHIFDSPCGMVSDYGAYQFGHIKRKKRLF
jgi:hypothetical protein